MFLKIKFQLRVTDLGLYNIMGVSTRDIRMFYRTFKNYNYKFKNYLEVRFT